MGVVSNFTSWLGRNVGDNDKRGLKLHIKHLFLSSNHFFVEYNFVPHSHSTNRIVNVYHQITLKPFAIKIIY